jgi:fumarate reductase subunit D
MAVKKTSNGSASESANESNQYLATLCYFGIFWVIPFALGKKNEFVLWHAKQGIVLSIAWFAVMMLSWIPIINFFIAFPATILLLVINVLAIMKTWRGEKWELPFLAQYVKTLGL